MTDAGALIRTGCVNRVATSENTEETFVGYVSHVYNGLGKLGIFTPSHLAGGSLHCLSTQAFGV